MQLEPSRAKMLCEKFWLGSSRAKINCTKNQLEPKRAISIFNKFVFFDLNSNCYGIKTQKIKVFPKFFGIFNNFKSSFWLEPNQASKKPARPSQILINEPCRAIKIRLEPSQNELARGSFHP